MLSTQNSRDNFSKSLTAKIEEIKQDTKYSKLFDVLNYYFMELFACYKIIGNPTYFSSQHFNSLRDVLVHIFQFVSSEITPEWEKSLQTLNMIAIGLVSSENFFPVAEIEKYKKLTKLLPDPISGKYSEQLACLALTSVFEYMTNNNRALNNYSNTSPTLKKLFIIVMDSLFHSDEIGIDPSLPNWEKLEQLNIKIFDRIQHECANGCLRLFFDDGELSNSKLTTLKTCVTSTSMIAEHYQNVLNVKLLNALYDYHNDDLDKAILEGADVNALGINWEERDEITTETPLVHAVSCGNEYAVTRLIAHGANIDNAMDENGCPIINIAIGRGYDKIAKLLLDKNPKCIDNTGTTSSLHDVSLLHIAILGISSYSLIEHGNWGDKETKILLQSYFIEEETTLPDNLSVQYLGNVNLIKMLVNLKPSLMIIQNKEGFTPFDITSSPEEYQNYFEDGNFESAMTMPSQEPGTITLKIHLTNRGDLNPVPITLVYDFKPLKQAFEEKARLSLPEYVLMQDVQRLRNGLNGVETRVAQHEGYLVDLASEIERQNPFYRQIIELQRHPVKSKMFEVLSRSLSVMLDGYKNISSGLFERSKTHAGDYLSQVLSFLGNQVPPPFNLALSIFATGSSIAADRIQTARYQKIANLLPLDRSIYGYAQELSYLVLNVVLGHFIDMKGNLDNLQDKTQVEGKEFAPALEISKRTLAITLYSIYHVGEINLDQSLSAEKRSNQFTDAIMLQVEQSCKHEYLGKLVSQIATQSRKTFTIQYNNHTEPSFTANQLGEALSSVPKSSKKCSIM